MLFSSWKNGTELIYLSNHRYSISNPNVLTYKMKTNKCFFPKIKGRKLEVIAQRFRGYITIDSIKKLEAKRMYKKSKLTRNTSWTSRLKEYWPAPKRLISKHNLHMPCRTNKFCCYFMEETTSKLMHEFKHWQKHVVVGQYSKPWNHFIQISNGWSFRITFWLCLQIQQVTPTMTLNYSRKMDHARV